MVVLVKCGLSFALRIIQSQLYLNFGLKEERVHGLVKSPKKFIEQRIKPNELDFNYLKSKVIKNNISMKLNNYLIEIVYFK